MAGSAAKVVITERQAEILTKFSTSRTLACRLVQRATIILLAFAGLCNQDIASQLGLQRHQVGLWRRRWQCRFDALVLIECSDEPAVLLRHAISDLLSDLPRPGAPSKFSPEQLALFFALACEPPEKSGLPFTHWTGAELACEAIKRGIFESISVSQVNRLLNEAELQPHRSRYWLNTTEQDPALFQARVEMVCATYRDAPELYSQHNTHTICVDEMTGIQALQRLAATLPMMPGHIELREFEYTRHGTLTYIGNFHVVTGELLMPTLGPTRTEADFAGHIEKTVNLKPEAGYVFVVDNLNTHNSATLVELVARHCGIKDDLGKKGKCGVLKSQKSRQELLSDLSHRYPFTGVRWN